MGLYHSTQYARLQHHEKNLYNRAGPRAQGKTGIEVVDDSPTVDLSASPSLVDSVCYSGKPLTKHDGAGIVEVLGADCHECQVGRTCHFQLQFHHPTPLRNIGHVTSHPDLMITITGENRPASRTAKENPL